MKLHIGQIKQLLGMKTTNTYNYRKDLGTFFSFLGLSLETAEQRLREVTKEDCLYFASDTGQQLEAVIFSAVSLYKKDVHNILEIGTGNGDNTVILASLFPDAFIHTFDLPKEDKDYKTLAWRINGEGDKFKKKILHERIVFHEKNSFYMLSGNLGKFDLAYVDGGHSYPSLAWDAMYAYNMTNSGGVIVFHDYNRPNNDPTRDSNHVKDLIDNYLKNILPEKIYYLPWAGYDPDARTCLLIKQ